MAARRLLIVLLILLGLSTLAAALLPPQALREGTTDTTSTTEETETERAPPASPPPGTERTQPITVGGKTVPRVSCPPKARRAGTCDPIEVGDQLTLVVRLAKGSKRVDQVEMPAFGLVDAIGQDEPARFEILLEAPRTYKIRWVSTGRIAARIEVEKPRTGKSGGKKRR